MAGFMEIMNGKLLPAGMVVGLLLAHGTGGH